MKKSYVTEKYTRYTMSSSEVKNALSAYIEDKTNCFVDLIDHVDFFEDGSVVVKTISSQESKEVQT